MCRNLPRGLRWAMCWLGLQLGLAGAHAGTFVVKPKSCPNKRLAPELYVVQQSGAELVGVTRCGRAVLSGEDNSLDQVRSMSTSVAAKIPPVPRKANRLLIRYQAAGGVPSDETLAKAGLQKVEDYRRGSFVIVEPLERVTAASVNALMDDEAVLHVSPDYVMSITQDIAGDTSQPDVTAASPSDPVFPELWGLKNIGALQAWTAIHETPKIVVAVIDTGVDYNHPDLKANMWTKSGRHGFDFYDDDDDPLDEENHGTHVAGTIAGVGNNGVGVVGVSWKTQIMAMRFMGPDGSGTTSDAVKCIDWAVANGAHILCNSWAGPGSSQELVEAVARAERKGVLFVAAAGNTANVGNNNDNSPYYPAALPSANVITVGAIDQNNTRGSFSHYGQRTVDIGAPGVGILSTVRNGQYARFDGTSMAAPHVAGAAALVWGKTFSSPVQDPKQMTTVRDLIYANARPVPALQNFWGHTAPARVPGGVLDVSFLSKTTPDVTPEPPRPTPPTPTPPSGPTPPVTFASAQFDSGTISATQSGVIASARISLREPSVVSIVANTSARNMGWTARIATGFSDKPALDQFWQDSIRNPQLNTYGSWTNMGSHATVQLPAGDHAVYWKIWVEPGASLTFHSGALLIQATPISRSSGDTAQRTILQVEHVEPE